MANKSIFLPTITAPQLDSQTLQRIINPILSQDFFNGKLITVSLAAGTTNLVNHGLGRKYTNCFPAITNEFMMVKIGEKGTTDSSQVIPLVVNFPLTGSFWII